MPYPYHKITEEDMAHLIRAVSRDRVCIGDEIPTEYYHDEMPEYGCYQPDIYIEAISKEEISAVMAYAYEHNIPVTARGAGTGLAGGATCRYGGIMLSLMRMNHIEDADTQNLTITAESGALLTDVADKAAAAGLFYPPDPGERTASIGGTVITNAGGMRAVRYGVTRDYVRCVEAVLPDGSIVEFSSNVAKNTTGYDIKDLIIGSEGTLCIVTKVTLRLIPAPNSTRTLVMTFSSIKPCIETVPKLLQTPYVPTAIEFLERELTDIVDRRLNKPFPVQEGSDFLIVMYDGSSVDEVDAACEMACEIAMEMNAIDVKICDSPERIGSVWSARAAILEGMKADSDAQEECDVVVPRARIADFVRAAQDIGRKYKIRVIVCGHAGDGNIHTEMLRNNLSDEEWKSNTRSCLKELYAKSKELGGQLSGEHGIGSGRLEFLEDFVGSRMYQLYQSVKLAFDDRLILNPGKIIEYK